MGFRGFNGVNWTDKLFGFSFEANEIFYKRVSFTKFTKKWIRFGYQDRRIKIY